MRLIYVVLLLVYVVKINAENVWLKDFTSTGLDLGYGVGIKLNDNRKEKNVPMTDRLSLDLNFGDVAGVSLSKPNSDGIELDFYAKDVNSIEEGRGKKDKGDKQMIQMVIGYKVALIASIMFAVLKVLTMKAILLAKAALIISLFGLILKLKNHGQTEIIEVEQHPPSHPPVYGGYGQQPVYQTHGYGGGYYNHNNYNGYGREAQASNVYPDVAYAPSGSATEAQTNNVYSAVMPNGSVLQAVSSDRSGPEIERRKDKPSYRKHKKSEGKGNFLSVKKFSSSAEM